jgi:uncharacterized protein (TIGR02996 family)
MSADRRFLDAIAEAPDDDLPRLAYSDWLEDRGDADRAEFIRLQVELARRPVDSPTRREQAFRARELLDRHETEWIAPIRPFVHEWRFRRGFVDMIGLTAANLEAQGTMLFQSSPLRRLWITETNGNLDCLESIPRRNQLTGLDFCGNLLPTAALPRLASFDHFGGLRSLGLLFNQIDDDGARLMCEHPFFQNLTLLRCGANPFTTAGRELLQQHFGERVSFVCERDEDYCYQFQPKEDRIEAGFGPDKTQILVVPLVLAPQVAVFDAEGVLLRAEQHDWHDFRETFLEQFGVSQPATVKVRRFRYETGAGIYDFPHHMIEHFETPNHPYISPKWPAHWLQQGSFCYDFDGSRGHGANFWLNREGEITLD